MWSVNGIEYNINDKLRSQVLIDACAQLGYDIPRFCYHENLKIAGNCRMCLIEDSKSPKPVICCAVNVSADLSIFTNTTQVKKSRESVMEFLLINHPLDCPICDQGGECDSQDLALVYGSDRGRFYDYKRNVEDKNCGPIVKTVMNRCIARTRCVRFATDVAGFETFGLTGRGSKMEIGSYVEKIIDTDLSGNLIDVCPVGALTSKPYAFSARPWELKKITTYNFIDEQPQLIRVDIKEAEILRIMPSKNTDIINTWITNRTRFSYEGLFRSRELDPKVLSAGVSWETLFKYFSSSVLLGLKKQVSPSAFMVTSVSDMFSFSDLLRLKHFKVALGSLLFNNTGLSNTNDSDIMFFLNNSLLDRENLTYNNIFLLNINLAFDAPVFNSLLSSFNESKLFFLWNSSIKSSSTHSKLMVSPNLETLVSVFSFKTWYSAFLENSICMYNGVSFSIKYFITKLFNQRNMKLWNLHFLPLLSFTTSRSLSVLNFSIVHAHKFSNDVSLSSWFWNDSNHNPIKNDFSVQLSSHKKDNNSVFLLPTKTFFEIPNFTVLNSSFRLFKMPGTVVATQNSSKTYNKILQLFYYLLGISDTALNSTVDNNDFFSKNHFFTDMVQSTGFFGINQLNKKLTSQNEYYTTYALTAASPTLLNLAKTYTFKTIY